MNTLMSFTFQYSAEDHKLQVLNYKNNNGEFIKQACNDIEVVGNNNDIFDLSEIGSDSLLTAHSLLDSVL